MLLLFCVSIHPLFLASDTMRGHSILPLRPILCPWKFASRNSLVMVPRPAEIRIHDFQTLPDCLLHFTLSDFEFLKDFCKDVRLPLIKNRSNNVIEQNPRSIIQLFSKQDMQISIAPVSYVLFINFSIWKEKRTFVWEIDKF